MDFESRGSGYHIVRDCFGSKSRMTLMLAHNSMKLCMPDASGIDMPSSHRVFGKIRSLLHLLSFRFHLLFTIKVFTNRHLFHHPLVLSIHPRFLFFPFRLLSRLWLVRTRGIAPLSIHSGTLIARRPGVAPSNKLSCLWRFSLYSQLYSHLEHPSPCLVNRFLTIC